MTKKKIFGIAACFAVLTAVLAAAAVVGPLDSAPLVNPTPSVNVASCKEAMRTQFRAVMASPESDITTTRPPECAGVSDEDLQRIVGQVVEEELSNG